MQITSKFLRFIRLRPVTDLQLLLVDRIRQPVLEAVEPVPAPPLLQVDAAGMTLIALEGVRQDLRNAGIRFSDLETSQSSLEDIFVSLVRTP